jgi:hypothetical protein
VIEAIEGACQDEASVIGEFWVGDDRLEQVDGCDPQKLLTRAFTPPVAPDGIRDAGRRGSASR